MLNPGTEEGKGGRVHLKCRTGMDVLAIARHNPHGRSLVGSLRQQRREKSHSLGCSHSELPIPLQVAMFDIDEVYHFFNVIDSDS